MPSQVNIKGKTTEKLGVIGKEKAIACEVIASVIKMIKTFNSLFVTMFGLGKIRYMPGTFGSLATVIIFYYLFHTLNISPNIILFGLVIIFIYSFYAVSSHIENSENKDPG